jgi:PAS domain S-box-containing protein
MKSRRPGSRESRLRHRLTRAVDDNWRLQVQYDVTRALAESDTLADAAPALLRAIGEKLRWAWGAVWQADSAAGVLRCVGTWNSPDHSMPQFDQMSRQLTFVPGIGLPGRVWKSGKAAWVLDVQHDDNFPRRPLAMAEGLHAGFAFPIRLHARVMGAVEFFSQHMRRPDAAMDEMTEAVGSQIGQFIERKQGEAAAARLAAIVQSSDDAIVGKNLDGIITSWNEGAQRLFGYTAEEMIGQPVLKLLPADRQTEERDILSRLRRGERMDHFETERLTKDGRRINVSLTISPIKDAQGTVIGASKIARDITDRKRHEQMLTEATAAAEAANKAKDQFLAVLSHELRTPLTPVLATLTGMNMNDLPQPLRRDLEVIQRNVELEARLIDDLLDLTRIARGKLELHLAPVDVHQVLQHAVEICREELASKQLHLAMHLNASEHTVRGDAARLQQVFWNLIKNAVKFTPAGGRIDINTSNSVANGQLLRVEVRDSGIGIDPDLLSKIFVPFEQGDRSVTHRFGGLGLGLAISRALAKGHGGALTATSEGKDKGATFIVEFPISTAAAKTHVPAQPATVPAERRSSLRVLLVEDHADTSWAMTRLLTTLGYDVQRASTVKAALEMTDDGKPPIDLLISDLGLPDGSGLELMRQLRQRLATIKGIALSGFGMEQDIQNSKDAGFARHLTKPIDFGKLKAVIREVTA